MLNHDIEERLAEMLVQRIEDVNAKVLQIIGETIKEIGTLKPTDAYKLGQIIKYGGSYEKIVAELAKVTKKNKKEIGKIFDEVATSNKQFAKDFYKYRGIDYVPYNKDNALKKQVEALANITANTYANISKTSGLGLIMKGADGKMRFTTLEQSYSDIVDTAIISLAQGKSTFNEEMRNAIKIIGHNGLVQYESGRVRRFDSAVRMNMLQGIRQLNIESQKAIGKEFDADGVEISVHENPAPDHADIQGRQFRNVQYENIETGGVGYDVKGRRFDGDTMRRIGELNCYHKIFSIVIGVSEPEYSDKELKEIKERNEKGFEYKGKHYTMYEGTQLQRNLELKIRKEKDTQIFARACGFDGIAQESQAKINLLTSEYKELCNISGLKPKRERMQVSGYRKIHTDIQLTQPEPRKPRKNAEVNETKADLKFYELVQDLEAKNVDVDNSVFNMTDEKLRNKQLEQLNELTDKYQHNFHKDRPLKITMQKTSENTYATTYYLEHAIKLNEKVYTTERNVVDKESRSMEIGWNYKTADNKKAIYTITHEYGHVLEYEYYLSQNKNMFATRSSYNDIDTALRDMLMKKTLQKTGEKLSVTEFKDKYFSRYGKYKRHSEWFAETFADYILNGNRTPWTETFGEWLEDFFNGN